MTVEQGSAAALNGFLASVEKRAYKTALLTTRKVDDALDIVQEAMSKLVQSYSHKGLDEWPKLFQSILNNEINNWHRSRSKISRWFDPFFNSKTSDDEEDGDPFDNHADASMQNPAELLASYRSMEQVMTVLESLPMRQRQAFLLRCWEGFSTKDTAKIMECSDGSVKTHFFRAQKALRLALKPHYTGDSSHE